MLICHSERHVEIGIAHIGALHVLEELLVKMILKSMLALGEASQGQFELTELSHSYSLRKNCAKVYIF